MEWTGTECEKRIVFCAFKTAYYICLFKKKDKVSVTLEISILLQIL